MPNLLAFASFVVVTTFTPGPNNLMAVANAVQSGLRKAMRFNFGVAAGFALVMLACSYLGLALASLLPRFQLIAKIVGAGYMVYLAYKIAWSGRGGHGDESRTLTSFWAGVWLQFLNPKGLIYGMTVVATFVLPYTHSWTVLLLTALALAFVALVSTTCWSLFGTLFQRWLTSYRRPFSIAMALLLVYSAIAVFH